MGFFCSNCRTLLDSPGLDRCPRCGAAFKGYKGRKIFSAVALAIIFALIGGVALGALGNLASNTIANILAFVGMILGIAFAIFLYRVMK